MQGKIIMANTEQINSIFEEIIEEIEEKIRLEKFDTNYEECAVEATNRLIDDPMCRDEVIEMVAEYYKEDVFNMTEFVDKYPDFVLQIEERVAECEEW